MINKFSKSLASLKSVHTLSLSAILIALAIVLEAVTARYGTTLKVNLTFLPLGVICAMFGPVVGAMAAGIIDLIGVVFLEGLPVSVPLLFVQLLSGMIIGCFLYKEKNSLCRCILTRLLICFFINIWLNTLSLYLFYGSGTLKDFPVRVMKNILLFVPEGILLFYLLKIVEKIRRPV